MFDHFSFILSLQYLKSMTGPFRNFSKIFYKSKGTDDWSHPEQAKYNFACLVFYNTLKCLFY